MTDHIKDAIVPLLMDVADDLNRDELAREIAEAVKAKMREVGVKLITQTMKGVPLEQLESLDDEGYARIAIAALFGNEARTLILGED